MLHIISNFLVSLMRVIQFYIYSIILCETVGFFFILQLHLNPVHAVVQLRPSLDHLNSGGSKRKNSVKGDAEVTVKLEDSGQEKSIGPSKMQVLSMFLSIQFDVLQNYGSLVKKFFSI